MNSCYNCFKFIKLQTSLKLMHPLYYFKCNQVGNVVAIYGEKTLEYAFEMTFQNLYGNEPLLTSSSNFSFLRSLNDEIVVLKKLNDEIVVLKNWQT